MAKSFLAAFDRMALVGVAIPLLFENGVFVGRHVLIAKPKEKERENGEDNQKAIDNANTHILSVGLVDQRLA